MEDGVDERPWIGVDLDGTLARDYGWRGKSVIGNPIPRMVSRIRRWHNEGKRVKIFTARAADETAISYIKRWLRKHKLPDLEITNEKDRFLIQVWDDKAVPMKKNKGTKRDDERLAETVVSTLLDSGWREFQDWVPYWVSPSGEIHSASPSHVVWAARNLLHISPGEGNIAQRTESLGWLRMAVNNGKAYVDEYKAKPKQLKAVLDWALERRMPVLDDKTHQEIGEL